MTKIWYAEPGRPVVQGTTYARDLSSMEMVVIRIPDPYDQGECELAVPCKYVHLTPPVLTDRIEQAWDECFTKLGYQYGPEEEANAKAWFKTGFNYRDKM